MEDWTAAPWDGPVGTHPLEQLKAAVSASHDLCYRRRRPSLLRLGRVLEAIDKAAPIVDVMIQQQPFIVNLVWGSLRFIIQVRPLVVTGP